MPGLLFTKLAEAPRFGKAGPIESREVWGQLSSATIQAVNDRNQMQPTGHTRRRPVQGGRRRADASTLLEEGRC